MNCESLTQSIRDPRESCNAINQKLADNGLFGDAKREIYSEQNSTWRISPEPFYLDPNIVASLTNLGEQINTFYHGVQRLYDLSCREKQPTWIREYLEAGKSEQVVAYGRMRRFKQDYPLIIRPDILLTNDGFVASELDSVPGGFGLLAALSQYYGELGFELIGGNSGILDSFVSAIRSQVSVPDPNLAIIVSKESQDYLKEMQWLSQALSKIGLQSFTLAPEDIIFQEDGLYVQEKTGAKKIHAIYRFFELFDLKNIPKMDLILYAVRKQLVTITPPLKSYLEEKMLFGLLHHPTLCSFWQSELGANTYTNLKQVFPKTWIVDPNPLPPHAVIPELQVGDRPVTDWQQLKGASKKERQFVLKVSGFSEQAWGSKGVTIGHDMAATEWGKSMDTALRSFPKNPYVLQQFHKSTQVHALYYDFESTQIKEMQGRVRLCPYYFRTNDKVELAGILATICPLDKKLIHGMVDAIMVPTALR